VSRSQSPSKFRPADWGKPLKPSQPPQTFSTSSDRFCKPEPDPEPIWPDDEEKFHIPPIDFFSTEINKSSDQIAEAEFEQFVFEGDSSLKSLAFFVHFGRNFTVWRAIMRDLSTDRCKCFIPEKVTRLPQRYLLNLNSCLEALKAVSPCDKRNRREIDFTSSMKPGEIIKMFMESALFNGSTFAPEVSEIVKGSRFDFQQSVQKFVTENGRLPAELSFEFMTPQKLDWSFVISVEYHKKDIKVWYHLAFGINSDQNHPIALFVRNISNYWEGSIDYFVWRGRETIERNPPQSDDPFQFCYYELIDIKDKV
jgi:hypothetical protein